MKSFHVVVLQRTAKKCTKNYNARAQPLNLLFGDFPAAVVVFFSLPNTTASPVFRAVIIKVQKIGGPA